MRGAGSLQQLLGKSTFSNGSRKRKTTQNVKDSSKASAEEDAGPAVATTRTLPAAALVPPAVESPIKAGHVRCPVCQRQLLYSQGEEDINQHLDKCLFQSNPTKSKQQATLLLYAQHTPALPPLSTEGDQLLQREGDIANDFSQPEAATAPAAATDQQHPTPAPHKTSLGEDDLEEFPSWPSCTPPSLSKLDNLSNGAVCGPLVKALQKVQEETQKVQPPKMHQQLSASLDITGSRQQGPLCFNSFIVGRQFQPRTTGFKIIPGCILSIEAEPNNPRDRNALLAMDTRSPSSLPSSSASKTSSNNSSVPVGHLSAAVARHLAPLIHKGVIAVEAVVQELPFSTEERGGGGGDRTPLPVEVRVTVLTAAAIDGSRGGGGKEGSSVGGNSVKGSLLRGTSFRAATAAARRAVEAAAQVSGAPIASGERLRRNFETLIATVRQHDAAVLDVEEYSFLNAYESLGAAAQCLFLRLCQRRGPLFRLLSLEYSDVPDAVAAAAELERAGIACCHSSSSLPSSLCPGSSSSSLDWELIAGALTVPELIEVLGTLIVPSSASGAAASTSTGATAAGAKNGKKKKTVRPVSTTPNRASVLAALQQRSLSSISAATAVRTALLNATGPVVQILDTALVAITRLQRLFFLNEGHSLGQFLAVDAGAVKYPSYSLTRQTQTFSSRAHLLEYETALAHAEVLSVALEDGDYAAAELAVAPAWAALDSNAHKTGQDTNDITTEEDINNLLKPFFLRRYCAPWVYCMMATAGVSLLERQKRYREAADRLQQLLGGWCCPGRRGGWWSRLSTDLEHLGRTTDALEIAESALADDSLRPGDRLSLQRRVLRLGKPPRRWRRPPWAAVAQREPREVRIQGRPIDSIVGIKSRFYGFDGEQCSVEDLALQYYASDEGGGWAGVHSEGGIFGTLFGLLMWPILFGPEVPDAFRAPFQTAPLDLDSEGFYEARCVVIEARLEILRSSNSSSNSIGGGSSRGGGSGSPKSSSSTSTIKTLLEESWNIHRGELCRGVNWDRWTLEELQEIAECIGGRGLAGVCELLASDHGGWQGGMPDLLLWDSTRCKAKLSEVKGPRDRLSDQQRAWIAALEDAGLECEVLKVVEPSETGGNGGGPKKRRG